MRVALVTFESFYDHSLALDYLVGYASERREATGPAEFGVFVHREKDDTKRVTQQVLEWGPDVVGFSTCVWNIAESVRAAKAVKDTAHDTVTVFGGMEASFRPRALLEDCAELDFVVVGEGEVPFVDLLGRLNRGEAFQTAVAGLAWRNATGAVISGGFGQALTYMDNLPSPFQAPGFAERGLSRVLYESYRGCAFRCDFCLYSREYAPMRCFSLDRVRDDLAAIARSGATHVRFVDATFNLDADRAKKILRWMAGCEANVCVEVVAELFDEEMISLLPSAGVRHVDIGLQSTQRNVLEAINRTWHRGDQFRKNLDLLRREPALTLNVELIAGLPEDTPAGLRRSLDEAVLMLPDHVSVYRLLGLKGTRLARRADELGLRFDPDPPYELIGSASFSPEDLDRVNDLTFAHLVLFNSGVGRYALRHLLSACDLGPSAIYDDFVAVSVERGTYSREEIRWLGRHHACGNRFESPTLPGLELPRVRAAIVDYLANAGLPGLLGEHRRIATDLADFGYRLAELDSAREHIGKAAGAGQSELRVAPWCQRASYPPSVLAELVRQGHDLGELAPEEVAGVVFFYHPELGPAALAIDDATASLLDQEAIGAGDEQPPVLDVLRGLAILVPKEALISG